MVRRAYLQARERLTPDASASDLHHDMILSMVRWIKFRVYPGRDWPKELGKYPKYLEAEVHD